MSEGFPTTREEVSVNKTLQIYFFMIHVRGLVIYFGGK